MYIIHYKLMVMIQIQYIYIDDLKDVCKAIIDKTIDKDFLEEIIIDYLYHTKREDLDDYDSYKCETCGDYVEMFEKEI